MTDERSAGAERRTSVERRYAGGAVQTRAPQPMSAAVYDTVTDGMLGWRFLRTWRWFGFIAGAILFAIACAFLSHWQFDRGQQASADNEIVSANYAADPVPITQALPTLGSFDPSQNWQRVTVTGTYDADDELYARNRSNGGTNGFEVLTPLLLTNGDTFLVDRGWVAPSADDPLAPAPVPPPASGSVDVDVQLRPSEAPQGAAITSGSQISSITLTRVQAKIGGDVYTGTYGVLVAQEPVAAPGLAPIQTTMPVEDVGVHYSYAVQWLAFALIGFVGLGLAARAEFRRLNSDDPEERQRASERLRRRARKPFTDEELEDEEIDGYLPLTRWGLPGAGSVSGPTAHSALPRTGPGSVAVVRSSSDDDASDSPDVYVLESGEKRP